jgi:hypothetical protein
MYATTTDSTSTNVIPAELQAREQWLCWHFKTRNDKQTKVPLTLTPIMHPAPGGKTFQWANARANDPSTWLPHHIAAGMHSRGLGTDGIGFVFAADDPYIGIDLDRCRDPETGDIEPWAAEIIDRCETYAEVSPSGTGVKLIARGTLPIETTGRKHNLGDGRAIEVYQHGRYFAITGQRLDDQHADVTDCQDGIDWLWCNYLAVAAGPTPKRHHACGCHHEPMTLPSDAELIDRIRASRQGGKFDRLWAGDLSDYRDDHSAADLALCCILAFWCRGDAGTIDRLFRQSGLMRDKWERSDYAQGTIGKAVSSCREFWQPQEFRCSSMEESTHRRTPETTQIDIPLDTKSELAPGIYRPEIDYRFSPCRRIKVALRKIDTPQQHRVSGFACRCHSCDLCRAPWETNRIAWFGGIVQQWQEISSLVTSNDDDKRTQNKIAYLAKKHEGVYYVRVPMSDGKTLWLCNHRFHDDAKIKTQAEARTALQYAIPDVPEKQRIGCTRALAYEHAREQSTGEWERVPDQPPLTKTTWDRIRDALTDREIAYEITDLDEYERRNLDYRIPAEWTDRDVADMYRDMIDGWMPEVDWAACRRPKAERKHLQLCGPPPQKPDW